MTFQYSKLKGPAQIRLLELEPAASDQPIQCKVITVNLDHNPSYNAVSYCWGSNKKPENLLCGHDLLPVTESLRRLLWRVRLQNPEPLLLWADAVCINQEDNDEKSSQLPLMPRIYRQAKQVIAWLGDDETDSEGQKTASLLVDLVAAYQLHCKEDVMKPYEHLSSSEIYKCKIPSSQDKRWLALGAILQRDWFKRIWILQEITLPDVESIVVIMGNAVLPWHTLILALHYAIMGLQMMNVAIGPIGIRKEPGTLTPLKRFIEARQMQAKRRTLLTLLISHRSAKASDPRDKVYALFNLANDMHRFPGLRPDYNIDTESLYILYATETIMQSDNLDILNVPRLTNAVYSSTRLPSWVPDWRDDEGSGSLCMSGYGVLLYLNFSACGESTSKPMISGHSLRLRGFRFDRVVARSLAKRGSPSVDTAFSFVSHFVTMALEDEVLVDWERVARARSGTQYLTGEKILDAYVLTMVCSFMPPGYTMDAFRVTDLRTRFTRPFNALFRLLYRCGLASVCFILVFLCAVLMAIFSFILWIVYSDTPDLWMGMDRNRCMVRTHKGYIGLATQLVQVGDVIVLMEGGKVPLILRSRDNHTWELIGDSYVHGIMSGEAWDGRQLEEFDIR